MTRIPAIEYASVFYAWLILEIFQQVEKKISTRSSDNQILSPTLETLYILCFVLLYVCMIVLSYLLQELDAKLLSTVLMIILIFAFTLFMCISFIVMNQLFGIHSNVARKDGGDKTPVSYGSVKVKQSI